MNTTTLDTAVVHVIDWNRLAADYRDAQSEAQRDDAFDVIRQRIAFSLPADADDTEGAITFLRNRGLWRD
jgi:hypothetical protein